MIYQQKSWTCKDKRLETLIFQFLSIRQLEFTCSTMLWSVLLTNLQNVINRFIMWISYVLKHMIDFTSFMIKCDVMEDEYKKVPVDRNFCRCILIAQKVKNRHVMTKSLKLMTRILFSSVLVIVKRHTIIVIYNILDVYWYYNTKFP